MCQKSKSRPIDPAAAQTDGAEIISSALQCNPLVAIATALVVPLFGLFRRPAATPTASVRKTKQESDSDSPGALPARRHQKGVLGAPSELPRTYPGATPELPQRPPGGGAPRGGARQKGGHRHG